MKYLNAFGRFWWDFLIGETPELFIGTVVSLAIIWLISKESQISVVILPLAVMVTVAISVIIAKTKT